MNQSCAREPDKFLKFLPFLTTDRVINSSVDDTGGSSFYGEIIDLNTFPGYQSVTVALEAMTYQLSATETTDLTGQMALSGHFVTDTSSAFGGSTAFGSTFALDLIASSAQSSEKGVLVGSVRVDSSSVSRYVRFIAVAHPTSGDGNIMQVGGCYILAGGDQLPTTNSSKYTS
jgi:hypothetical protein